MTQRLLLGLSALTSLFVLACARQPAVLPPDAISALHAVSVSDLYGDPGKWDGKQVVVKGFAIFEPGWAESDLGHFILFPGTSVTADSVVICADDGNNRLLVLPPSIETALRKTLTPKDSAGLVTVSPRETVFRGVFHAGMKRQPSSLVSEDFEGYLDQAEFIALGSKYCGAG